jgi:hypothetical protein
MPGVCVRKGETQTYWEESHMMVEMGIRIKQLPAKSTSHCQELRGGKENSSLHYRGRGPC